MGHRRYGRYRGYSRRYEFARRHMEQRRELSELFGGIDRDVEAAFFALSRGKLAALLEVYGHRYGTKAEAYARATFPKWKAGEVGMSGQTAKRLLNLLPPRLSPDARYDLVKKLRTHYLESQVISITVEQDNWRHEVLPAVDTLVQRAALQNLPSDVTKVAHWLTSEDAKAAQALLARAEEEEARIRTSLLNAEFERISAALAHLDSPRVSASHTISIPNGEIRVTIKPSRQQTKFLQRLWRPIMSERSDIDSALPQRSQPSRAPAVRRRDNLLDVATSELTPDEVEAIRAKAIDTRLDLDVSARQAEDRFVNASRDMVNTVNLANELDQGRNDYSIDSSFDTASGRTTVRVKRATNQSLVVVAVVIAIVLLLVFLAG